MKFKQQRINSSRKLLVYPAKTKSVQRRMAVTKENPSRILISLTLHRKQMSSSAETADNSDSKVVKELLHKMSVT